LIPLSLLHSETITADVTRFSPDEGQPLFPAGNINVFKQYVLAFDESERVGRTVEIDLWLTSIEFGAEVEGGINAAVGLEVGLCFGGNADFDLGFKPTITLPDRYPTEFPIYLTVDEGLMPDSHFTTTFPPLGKAYADLIFDLGAYIKAKACYYGCIDGIDFDFSTCDIPAIGGYNIFKESIRCDPTLQEEAYCAIELASFNREDDNIFRMLNVTADNRFEFLKKPYLDFGLFSSAGTKKEFFANSDRDTLEISGVHRFTDGSQVRLSSTGTLPGGLVSGKTYYVTDLSSNGPSGIELQLAVRKGGPAINLSSLGTGQMEITLFETNKPEAPTLGKYGTISISAPTVGTDSRVSAIDDKKKPFTVNPLTDQLVITSSPGFKNGNKVRISSAGELPDGLSRGCVYYVVNANLNGLVIELATRLGGPAVDISDFGTGTHRIALNAEFNSADGLKSTGAEDIMSIGVDVVTLISDLLFPPSFPSMSDSGEIGPLNWDYTIASLELGPALQLQTDFEMTWDLVVTEITFREPGTFNPKNVLIDGQAVSSLSQVTPKRTVHLTNAGPNALPAIVLQDTQPVQVNIMYTIAPRLKTVVSTPFLGRVKYAAIGAGASVDAIGELRFGPLLQGEHNFKIGEFEVYDGDPSPIESAGARTDFNLPQDLDRYDLCLIDTASESVPSSGCAEVIIYKTGSTLSIRIFDVVGDLITDKPASQVLSASMLAELEDLLDPWPLSGVTDKDKEEILKNATAIAGLQPGVINFSLQAAGPPSFFWSPDQIDGNGWTDFIVVASNPPVTNWLEIISIPASSASYPGEFGTGSDATIDASPFPSLYKMIEIASLKVRSERSLFILGDSDNVEASLTVNGGLIENDGTIQVKKTSPGASNIDPFLRLDSADSVLTGSGTINLANDGSLLAASSKTEPVTFTNYNRISGGGVAMDLYNQYPDSTINNHGDYRANDPGGEFLIMSARHIINHKNLTAYEGGRLSSKGEFLENRVDSRTWAVGEGSLAVYSFDEVNHSGWLFASSGGEVIINPWNFPRSSWNAGLSFSDDVGTLRAVGAGGLLRINNADITGGFIRADYEGTFEANDTSFSGSVITIGFFDSEMVRLDSGTMILIGTQNLFTDVCLTNFGTLRVPGSADFSDTLLFANNGIIEIPQGGMLQIREITEATSDPNATDLAKSFPGTANATGETLVGGTWDISGTLLIEGAAFTGMGANAARANTSHGSIVEAEGSVSNIKIEDDKDRLLSLGNPAEVVLRGSEWSFPSLDSLEINGGILELREGADFPSGPFSNLTVDDFTNRGELLIDASSTLKVSGAFIQTGAKAKTNIFSNGEILSSANHFIISGGSVSADANSGFMNRLENTFFGNTTIHIESPMLDTNETDPFSGDPVYVQEQVNIILGDGVEITHIDAGTDITLHGSAIYFPSLTNHVESNAGRFTVSGDGIDNPGRLSAAFFTGDTFTNTGELILTGYSSEFKTAGYLQLGNNAITHLGAGSRMVVYGDLFINGGEIHLEIDTRPSQYSFGMINASRVDFGDGLVINFTDALAATTPDVGDTWEIISRKNSTDISGISNETVTYLLDGAPMPGDWLPVGTHLELVNFQTDFGTRGLGIRVVPDGGFVSYDSWASATGLDRATALSDPLRDANSDGIINALEFLFGPNDGDGTYPGQQQQRLLDNNGQSYFELSFMRPSRVDATYTPYYSQDLKNWYPAGMVIMDIVPAEDGSNLEWVTLQSTFGIPDGPLYFRVKGDLNVDSFDYGILPEKPINHSGGLNFMDEVLRDSFGYDVSYTVEPGRVLYFNVQGLAEDSAYGGTAANGVDRNYIYQDWSSLATASVHAGLLKVGERGIIKVTFIEPQQTTFIGSTQNVDTSEQATTESYEPYGEPYSYRIERHSGDADQ